MCSEGVQRHEETANAPTAFCPTVGADGTVEISPAARYCIKEADIIVALYKGITKLLKAKEDKLAKKATIDGSIETGTPLLAQHTSRRRSGELLPD
ncbi:unnamed protein product [Vitrella brassicaformis CCMP3155]|uniref:Uncharacterized protein n=1 Tax=Vitrella brassicaformis (strain CCMP3155) TaxID=1169540 RepID=A0A0G4FV75_VITBC|nr:unnamed protein product [Vitrella brassicaformis CCMP3155]|eukprot:CEM18570.1 unnamed protein product [Vitrella brassicaformis CCMP3155]